MVRCFNCQIKIDLSEEICPFCGRAPFDGEIDEFAAGNGVLLRYNGTKKDVTLPTELHTVGEQSFDCTAVRSVIIPEGYTEIEDAAFLGCTSLNYVEFPDTLKKSAATPSPNAPICVKFPCPVLAKRTKPPLTPKQKSTADKNTPDRPCVCRGYSVRFANRNLKIIS